MPERGTYEHRLLYTLNTLYSQWQQQLEEQAALKRLGMDVESVIKRHKERMKAVRQMAKARPKGDSQYDIPELLKRPKEKKP